MYCQGTGIKTIHGMLGTSRNTIKKYVRIWHALGMSYEKFCAHSDEELPVLFSAEPSAPTDNRRRDELEALMPKFSKELKKNGSYPRDTAPTFIRTVTRVLSSTAPGDAPGS